MWTYEIYHATDTGDAHKNLVRKNFGFDGKDAYFLSKDGVVSIVQWEGQYPAAYGATLEEAAQNHCYAMEQQLPPPEPAQAPDPETMEAALNELGVMTRE